MSAGTGYVRGGVQTAYYRSAAYPTTVQPPRQGPTVTDDYERWYTEATPNNRMLLSLRSGLLQEIGWALDRLCRLCNNEQFMLRAIPGLTDALFEWPEWYLSEHDAGAASESNSHFFALPRDLERKRRHALESLFILRNAGLNEPNAAELAGHPRTNPLVFKALKILKPDTDANAEFLLHSVEILHAISPTLVLPRSSSLSEVNPLLPVAELSNESSNRNLIISCLSSLSVIFTNPLNSTHLSSTSLALVAAIRYLPLFLDKPLVDACLNYLYAHLSNPSMARAFLLHTDMPSTLKLLVSLLISEQVEELRSVDLTGTVHTAPAIKANTANVEISGVELESLAAKTEPERCFEWMKAMFVPKADGELTQVDFWNLYKDIFTPYGDVQSLLVASDVIKNVNIVFPTAQAMVLPGPPQKFVVRGVDRRQREVEIERFKCQWNRGECAAAAFKGPGELLGHLEEHLDQSTKLQATCQWSSCNHAAPPVEILRHVLTHIPLNAPATRHPAQPQNVTLATPDDSHPTTSPTQRPPPPAPRTMLTYTAPSVDPPSSSLTALLIIRTLFRTSFASSAVAPRADADHFGFPGVVDEDETEQEERTATLGETDREGERRGRRAFMAVRNLMESVQIRDPVLMGWVEEMVDAGITGKY